MISVAKVTMHQYFELVERHCSGVENKWLLLRNEKSKVLILLMRVLIYVTFKF
jgi:hypothetical protein